MPRARRNANSLGMVQTQITRMQAALAKLQVEIARLRRAEMRGLSRASRQSPATLGEARQAAERELILQVGEDCRWNRSRMARTLRIDRKSLYRKIQKYRILSTHPAPDGPPPSKAAKAARPAKASRRR